VSLCTYLSEHPLDKCHELKLTDQTANWPGDTNIGPLNLGEWVGNWCLKLQTNGLVVQDIASESRHYRADPEAHIDEPGISVTYTWTLWFQPEVLELKRIIEGLRGVAAQ